MDVKFDSLKDNLIEIFEDTFSPTEKKLILKYFGDLNEAEENLNKVIKYIKSKEDKTYDGKNNGRYIRRNTGEPEEKKDTSRDEQKDEGEKTNITKGVSSNRSRNDNRKRKQRNDGRNDYVTRDEVKEMINRYTKR